MYEYKFVEVNVDFGVFVARFKGYREIIEEYAKQGYRYVGYIPQEQTRNHLATIDLIFEKLATNEGDI